LPVGWRNRAARPSLLFSVLCVATAGTAWCELRMMHSATPQEFSTALRWLHVPMFFLFASLVGFVRSYLDAGSTWLAWSVIGSRAASLVADFTTGVNLNYLEMPQIVRVLFLGEPVAVPQGTPNPWMV